VREVDAAAEFARVRRRWRAAADDLFERLRGDSRFDAAAVPTRPTRSCRRRRKGHVTRRVRHKRKTPKSSTSARTRLSLQVKELDDLQMEIKRRLDHPRWNTDPEDVQRSVAKLVLTLVEFLRKLMERQAVRRMETGTVTDEETEALGTALMRLEETIVEMARRFDLSPR
jgi:hypothetical protein